MTKNQIKILQSHVGTEPDGFWGPKSIAACQRHLTALMPRQNPWPATSQKSLTAYYGKPGDISKIVNLDVSGLGVAYLGKPVSSVRCHNKVAASLRRILEALAQSHPEIISDYAGVYNNRPMRGGYLPSLHARGAAIDLAPGSNRNRQSWPVSATMPIEVMETFAREGWKPAGAFWHRDAMHFQATR